MKCENCRTEMLLVKSSMYRYELSGLENVFLDKIEVYNCAGCDVKIPVIPKILKLHNTIANAIVAKKSLLSGDEIKFLRKNLRLKSQDLANLLRTDKSVYSRWENGSQKISPQSDLLIRFVYLRLLEEKKGVRFEQKIVESLSETTDEQTAIVVDVERIENHSYMPLTEALVLADAQNIGKVVFDFDLDETNQFLSEIEEPLPFKSVSGGTFKYSAATNQELALAA
ncbi:MAG TPA: type II TA system antitoxin MqsA family protein [Pyrinomonadaceae bacterium]|nr:type II TA system antitoxin MqsA family protein [Pyrinomonadaceae bacterium]